MKKATKFASLMDKTGFADFESKLDSVNRENGNFTDALASIKTFTSRKQIHEIFSFSLVFVDTNWKLLHEKAKCGENAGENVFQTLDKLEENLLLSICKNKPPLSIQSLTDEEKQHFESSTNCETCHIKFDKNDRLRCKNLDHFHYTNRYGFASCTIRNLLNRIQNQIQIYFHNFCSYDSKLLLNFIDKNEGYVTPNLFVFKFTKT